MVTMQQIADKCGVSRGTVDRALHHKEGVREDVAQRIRDTARDMGYLPIRSAAKPVKEWKLGVILHSARSAFVQLLCQSFQDFPQRENIPHVTVVIRTMDDMDVWHQLALIDELVNTEHIDGLALMPLANTLIRDKINTLSEQKSIPVVTFNTDIADANRLAYIGPDNIASGQAAAALMGMVMQGHGTCLPILGQRSGHYGDSQRLTGFLEEMQKNYPNIRIMQPEYTFLDEELAKRITLRAIQSDADLRGIYIASSGRTGVYQALRQTGLADRIHVIVHDVTPDNIEMVREGIVDFIIGQDEQTQGNLPLRLLYDYLEHRHFPENRIHITDITIKFRCNINHSP